MKSIIGKDGSNGFMIELANLTKNYFSKHSNYRIFGRSPKENGKFQV